MGLWPVSARFYAGGRTHAGQAPCRRSQSEVEKGIMRSGSRTAGNSPILTAAAKYRGSPRGKIDKECKNAGLARGVG